MPPPTYGLQLYTVPRLLESDFAGTLERISDLGYDDVEFFGPFPFSPPASRQMWRAMAEPEGLRQSGYYDRSPKEVARLLDEFGLEAPSVHCFLPTLRETLEPALERAKRIGHETLVCNFLPPGSRTSIDDYRRLADEFNRIGERAREAGLRLGYHNHCFELAGLEGDVPYRILLEETQPNLLTMELDIFWTATAGYDPIDLLENYPDRFTLCHLKDRREERVVDDSLHLFETPDELETALANMTDLGDGITDVPDIIEAARTAGVEHAFVERDLAENPTETMERSIRYLRSLE